MRAKQGYIPGVARTLVLCLLMPSRLYYSPRTIHRPESTRKSKTEKSNPVNWKNPCKFYESVVP